MMTSMASETPEAFTRRATNLLQRAIHLSGGANGDRARLNRLMQEAKIQRLTWIEGLCYAVEQLGQSNPPS